MFRNSMNLPAGAISKFQAITPLDLITSGAAEDDHWKEEMMAEVEEDWASL